MVVEDAATVRSADPDFRKLARVPTRGVMLTSRSDDSRYDFVSRFFAPSVGIDEDPVHRIGPLLSGALLVRPAGEDGLAGVPGIVPRRRAAGSTCRASESSWEARP